MGVLHSPLKNFLINLICHAENNSFSIESRCDQKIRNVDWVKIMKVKMDAYSPAPWCYLKGQIDEAELREKLRSLKLGCCLGAGLAAL